MPQLPEPERLPRIVHQTQCELKDAYKHYPVGTPQQTWLKSAAAGFTVTMKAEEISSAAPEFSLLGPLAGGSYVFPIGAGLAADNTHTGTAKYLVRFDGLNNVHCDDPADEAVIGSIGIENWLAHSLADYEHDTFRIPDTIGHTAQFVMTLSGHATPSYSVVRSKGTGTFSTQHAATNILDIAITDNTPKGATKVIIIGDERKGAGGLGGAARNKMIIYGHGARRTSPLIRRGAIVNHGSAISDDARARIDNELNELYVRSLNLR
jgi:hypothetical protein